MPGGNITDENRARRNGTVRAGGEQGGCWLIKNQRVRLLWLHTTLRDPRKQGIWFLVNLYNDRVLPTTRDCSLSPRVISSDLLDLTGIDSPGKIEFESGRIRGSIPLL